MFRSIRWTLQLWHAAILGMALVSFGTALYLSVSGAQLSNVDAELERAAHVLINIPPGFPPGDGGRGGMGMPPWGIDGGRGGGMMDSGFGSMISGGTPDDSAQEFIAYREKNDKPSTGAVGKWIIKDNDAEITIDIKVNRSKLTGTLENSQIPGVIELKEGKVEGNIISFVIARQLNDQNYKIYWSGTLAGNQIKFKRTYDSEFAGSGGSFGPGGLGFGGPPGMDGFGRWGRRGGGFDDGMRRGMMGGDAPDGLTREQISKISEAVQADIAVLTKKLIDAQKDAINAALHKKETVANIKEKIEAVARIQSEIAMLRFTKGIKAISFTDEQRKMMAASSSRAFQQLFSSGNGDRSSPGIFDWWAQIPRNVLQRIGQSEQDQPYFIIWGMFGEILQASSPSLNVPLPDFQNESSKKANEGKSNAGGADFRNPFSAALYSSSDIGTPVFRRRGILREVILRDPFSTTVLVGKSMQAEEASLTKLRWELFGAGFGVLIIGLCGGWLLSRRITRPIRAISATARAISASDLSSRINVMETESELGSLALTLNKTFDRLETAFQRQVRFTADASHELRTPLSIIHSHAELALARERSAPEYKQAMETCLRAAKRTKSLVDALLVLARADAGKLALKYERFNLKDTSDEALAMVAAQAQERNVSIETDVQPLELEADHTRILQLLTNLLGNAIQYNRPGGRVVLTVTQRGSSAILMVADTGAGIAAPDQPHVFERFFRADKARSREAGGSGLGLAICQSIVEAHHGSISFTSRPGEGTTFTVQLPFDSKTSANRENPNSK
jgi:heavy metal sensor kinase